MKDIRLKQAIYTSVLFLIAFLCQNCTTIPTSSTGNSIDRTSPMIEHLSQRP